MNFSGSCTVLLRRIGLEVKRNRYPEKESDNSDKGKIVSMADYDIIPGGFALPGLVKITVVHKPATPKRKGINPFTKQEQIFAAKPARKVIKVRPFKALKDMAK